MGYINSVLSNPAFQVFLIAMIGYIIGRIKIKGIEVGDAGIPVSYTHLDQYGDIDIIYGSRSMDDLVDIKEIQDEWCNEEGINVHLTIDRPQEGWDGHVGFVPSYVNELNLSLDKTILICGPPIMIKFTLQNLQALGFSKSQVYTTMELRMKCGIGKLSLIHIYL